MARETVQDFFDGGAKSFKFETIGTYVEGVVLSQETRPARKYTRDGSQGELIKDKNGKQTYELVITLQTGLRDPQVPDDDGRRTIYVSAWRQIRAIGDAVHKVGGRHLQEGGTLKVAFVGEEAVEGTATKAKLYTAVYSHPSAGAENDPVAASVASHEPAPVAQATQSAPVAQEAAQPQEQPNPATTVLGGLTDEQRAALAALGLA